MLKFFMMGRYLKSGEMKIGNRRGSLARTGLEANKPHVAVNFLNKYRTQAFLNNINNERNHARLIVNNEIYNRLCVMKVNLGKSDFNVTYN